MRNLTSHVLVAVLVIVLPPGVAVGQGGVEYPADSLFLPEVLTGVTVGSLEITDTGTITDLNARISFQASLNSNSLLALSLDLVSPSGTVVRLATGQNPGDGNLRGPTLFATLFDDEASRSIDEGQPPYAGSFQPQETLSAFDGESITGTWQLVVFKNASVGGNFEWSLLFNAPDVGVGTEVESRLSPIEVITFPNPSVLTTNLYFTLPVSSVVRVTLYDALGRRKAVLIDGQLSAGTHGYTLDTSGLSPGVYYCRLIVSGNARVTSMVVQR